MIKVTKFGGSSVANAAQFKKVRKIMLEDPSRKFIVVSACGKEDSEDHKITDLLYLCQAHIRYGVSYEPLLQMIEDKYRRIKKNLKLKIDLDQEFYQIREILKKDAATDYLVSRGEYLTGLCMAEYLHAEFADAAKIVSFRYDGSIDMERTAHNLEPYAHHKGIVLVPGFYGCMPNGVIKVMARGGSDITGAVLANLTDADVYENWTDVSGFMVVDPRIVKNPMQIKRITYSELREMSYMGANVLNDESIFPVKSKNIPINIRNTNEPDAAGTWIVESTARQPKYTITGIAGKKDFCSVLISKALMNSEIGFYRRVSQAFEDHGVSVEHMPSGIDTMTVVVHESEFLNKEQQVVSEIHRQCSPDSIEIDSGLALIAVVGRGMKSTRGTAGRIFSALAHAHVNVRMIDQGSSELNIIIAVDNQDFETAIRAIYDIFVTTQL